MVLERQSEPLRDLGLFSHSRGWVIAGERLLVSQDGGGSWQDITPEVEGELDPRLLGAAFYDRLHGWAALAGGEVEGLAVAHTRDGGRTWQVERLVVGGLSDAAGIESAYFDVLDAHRAYLALKLHSGSSFSLGRLFYLQGESGQGFDWEERNLPVGEPVIFEDELNGWTSGGADGKQAYRTSDGGWSWEDIRQNAHSHSLSSIDGLAGATGDGLPGLASLPQGTLAADSTLDGYVWAIVQDGACLGEKRPGQTVTCTQRWELLASEDWGETWEEVVVESDPGG